jgi:hypothetical protein
MLCSSSSVLQRNVMRPIYVCHDKTTSAKRTMPECSVITSLSHPTTSSPSSPVSASSHIGHSHCHLFTHTPFLYPHLISTTQKRPPSLAPPLTTPTPQLDHFIAYTLHRTQLHPLVTFLAHYPLQCLKARFPMAKGSLGHHLFISTFMPTLKIICDDTYSSESWCVVRQGMFALQEINQIEQEECSYLEWQLNVNAATLPFTALYPLQHLKACFPPAKGSSGHCLFISAFMPTLKLICDNIYSSKS